MLSFAHQADKTDAIDDDVLSCCFTYYRLSIDKGHEEIQILFFEPRTCQPTHHSEIIVFVSQMHGFISSSILQLLLMSCMYLPTSTGWR